MEVSIAIDEHSKGSDVIVLAEDALPLLQQLTFRFTIGRDYQDALRALCGRLRWGIEDEGLDHGQEPPAGWYPDPWKAATQRYWDGKAWTGHTA